VKLLFITFFSFSLFAGTIEEKEIFRTPNQNSIVTEFDINKELGRAWLKINICEYLGEESICDNTNLKIDGLTLININDDLSHIVYTNHLSTLVCAEVKTKGKKIFKHDVISETGNCSFYTEYDKKKIDDGFHQYTQDYNVLFFKVVAP
jgi:hypothetical protein